MYHGYNYGRRTRIQPAPAYFWEAAVAAIIGAIATEALKKPQPAPMPGANAKLDLQPTATQFQKKVAEGMDTSIDTSGVQASDLVAPPTQMPETPPPVVAPQPQADQLAGVDPTDQDLFNRLMRYRGTTIGA